MKTLLLKAREYKLTDADQNILLGTLFAVLFCCVGFLGGMQYGKEVMTSGKSIIVKKATYTCAKTNELIGSEF